MELYIINLRYIGFFSVIHKTQFRIFHCQFQNVIMITGHFAI